MFLQMKKKMNGSTNNLKSLVNGYASARDRYNMGSMLPMMPNAQHEALERANQNFHKNRDLMKLDPKVQQSKNLTARPFHMNSHRMAGSSMTSPNTRNFIISENFRNTMIHSTGGSLVSNPNGLERKNMLNCFVNWKEKRGETVKSRSVSNNKKRTFSKDMTDYKP